jgi:hypothetical protein
MPNARGAQRSLRELLGGVLDAVKALEGGEAGASTRLEVQVADLKKAMAVGLGSAEELVDFDRRLEQQMDVLPPGSFEQPVTPIYYFIINLIVLLLVQDQQARNEAGELSSINLAIGLRTANAVSHARFVREYLAKMLASESFLRGIPISLARMFAELLGAWQDASTVENPAESSDAIREDGSFLLGVARLRLKDESPGRAGGVVRARQEGYFRFMKAEKPSLWRLHNELGSVRTEWWHHWEVFGLWVATRLWAYTNPAWVWQQTKYGALGAVLWIILMTVPLLFLWSRVSAARRERATDFQELKNDSRTDESTGISVPTPFELRHDPSGSSGSQFERWGLGRS